MGKSSSVPNILHSKLLSYSALASSFLLHTSDATAQCGTSSPFNPSLGIDIDGDGSNDISLQWNQFFTASPLPLAGQNISNTDLRIPAGTVSYPFSFPQTGTIYGCPVINVPNGTNGFMSVYYNGYINKSVTTFRPDISYIYKGAIGFATSSFIYAINAANAYAYAGNQIIGLTTGGSNLCGLIGSSGANSVPLGNANIISIFGNYILSNYNRYYYREGINATIIGTNSNITPVTCTISTYIPTAGTINLYYPLTIPPVSNPSYLNTTIPIVVPFNYEYITTPNTNNTSYLGVQFQGPDQDGDGNPDHYIGWVELFVHADSRVTCLGTGYNSCSIESAGGTASACPVASDIAAGAPDPGNACMAAPCGNMIVLAGTPSISLDQESSDWIKSTQTLPPNGSIDYDAEDFIQLDPGFCAPPNTNFAAFIDGCNNGGGGFNAKENEEVGSN